MKHREAKKEDLPKIKEILAQAGLPTEDCEAHVHDFLIMEKRSEIVAIGGLEICDKYGLVRSIVVIPKHRGQGIGEEVLAMLESKAISKGIDRLYLLTETAVEYFQSQGFKIIDRDQVPKNIANTRQFKELCPSTAKVMYRSISRV